MKLFGIKTRQQVSFRFNSTTFLAALSATVLSISSSMGITYTDATGELFGTYPNVDIASVKVTNDLTEITFIINVTENPLTNDWGRYMIAIDSAEGGLIGVYTPFRGFRRCRQEAKRSGLIAHRSRTS